MERLLALNYGQHILYSFLCISIHGRRGSALEMNEYSEIISQVIELTDAEHYDGEDTPDVLIMIQPEKAFEIFCDFWDENEIYFAELF
jgi:hypothetical protein